MTRPHIALVIASMNGGGAQRVMSDLANHWAERGYEVSLVTLDGARDPDTYPLHSRVQRIRIAQGRSVSNIVLRTLWTVMRLRRCLRRLAPRAVVSFIDTTNVLTILATRGLPFRVIACERTDPAVNPAVSRLWGLLRRLTYRFADRVVAQTSHAAAWLEAHCAVRPIVIPNPIRELPMFAKMPREPLLVAAGRLDWYKGFDVLLRAFAAVASRFPEWRLAILGEGPERAELIALSRTLGIDSRVELAGQVRDIETWFSRAGIFVHASRFEGFPNVLLEAMALGAAVVATNCRSGPADLIDNGVNGRLVPVDDVDGLAAATAELMSDSELRTRYGKSAEQVRQRYAMTRIVEQWNEVLELPSLPPDFSDSAASLSVIQR